METLVEQIGQAPAIPAVSITRPGAARRIADRLLRILIVNRRRRDSDDPYESVPELYGASDREVMERASRPLYHDPFAHIPNAMIYRRWGI
jgi:hypothetical protein